MDIESELPEDFEDFSTDRKIQELEKLESNLDSSTDSGAIKKRMVQELIRHYQE